MTRQCICAALRLTLSVVLVALIFVAPSQAQTFSVFHAFSGTDGSVPNGDLTKDFQGNYYGTAQLGGTTSHGVVFKLDSTGNETVLYNFTGGADGSNPYGRLLRTDNGTLFGMTLAGGDPSCQCGTVFRLTANGNFRVLHTFLGGTDGAQNFGQPGGGLVRIGQELYGVTYFGGDLTCDPGLGCGTIFKLSQTGQETILHTFSGAADGAFPRELIADSAGNLYGVTEAAYSGVSVYGAVFKLDTNNQLSVLYSFQDGNDGSYPYWRLTQAGNGILYGTTQRGGNTCSNGLCGTVFSLDTNTGTETVLHRFGIQPGDGAEPSGAILETGGLIGSTWYGGKVNGVCPFGCGVVYQVTNGGYKLLHSFTGGVDGYLPTGALFQDHRVLYGAAALGGSNNSGVIFRITH